MRKKIFLTIIILAIFFVGAAYSQSDEKAAENCMTCHKEVSTGLFKQWFESTHGDNDVTCIDCHGAAKSEKDAFTHYDATIATLVTPKDCGNCHEQEMLEVDNSYHATAGLILESADAYLAHTAGGLPAAITGCESCHGAKVKIDNNSPNKLSPESWPNSGIGRINLDGSKGSCTACHTRHSFSKAQARQPEACSKCHLGPDHPQKEVYEASKHGNAYYTNIDNMNLKSDSWVVGQDYFEAPTCATCHMSATKKQALTHDVGQRIAWTLRPIVSKHKDNWQKKRENMKDVCSACHGTTFYNGHFYQFDALVQLYNEKYAKPALSIMNLIKEKKLLKRPASFSNKIEWTFWELWHHEGRRARHGAAMMGPDYTWWHGIYEVAQHFYFKFLPEAEQYNDPDVNKYIENMLTRDPMHNWINGSTDELKKNIRSGKIQEVYKKMFKDSK